MPDTTAFRPGEPCWVDLGSPDVEASKAFYAGLFGWDAATSDDPAAGGYTMFLKDGKNVGGLGPLFGEGQPPSWSTYFAVEDADATTAAVTAAGGQAFVPPMDVMDVGRMAVLADPTGVAFSIWQPGTHRGFGVVGEPGTFGWTELSTRDQATATAFYGTIFGWTTRVSPGYTEFQLADDSIAGCMDVPPMVPAQVPGFWMPYFNAEDPDAAAQQAGELGATVLMPGMDFGEGRFSVVSDPQGATFGLLRLH